MKKIFLLFLFLLFAAPCAASQWICFEETTKRITARFADAGDSDVPPENCIEATEYEWIESDMPYRKVERSYPVGDRVVMMSDEEIRRAFPLKKKIKRIKVAVQ